jgi:hypothetical protein
MSHGVEYIRPAANGGLQLAAILTRGVWKALLVSH